MRFILNKKQIAIFFIFSMVFISKSPILAQMEDTIHNPSGNNVRHIAYGSQEEWKRTAAISEAKGKELEKSFTSNLGNTLFGRIPGLTVMQGSSEPGQQSPAYYSRGLGTFGVNDMLIIVDGFEGSLEQFIPEEIESVSLLKDASATAIYGSRGANGVLLVTTKRGIYQPLAIEVGVKIGVHQPTRVPKFLDSYNYSLLYNEALRNDGFDPTYYGYSTDAIEAYRTQSDPYFYPNVNWYNEIMRDYSPMSNYNINFRGGDANVRYFGMLNLLMDNGLLKKAPENFTNTTNSQYKRYNFRANIDANLSKSTLAYVTLGGAVEDKSNPIDNTVSWFFNRINSIPSNLFPVFNPNGSYGGNSEYTNPLGNLLETGIYTSNGITIQSSLKLTQKLDVILKGLSASAAVSFNNYFVNNSNKSRTYQQFSIFRNPDNTIGYTPYGQTTSLSASEGNEQQWRNISLQGFLNYSNTLGIHDIDALVMGSTDTYSTYAETHPYRHVALNGRFTYALSRKYISEFSFSYMGSENFAPGKRFGFFPAFSLGWLMSNEDFLSSSEIFDFLKLRASVGLVGNDLIGGERFMFDQYYRGAGTYYFGTGNTEFSSHQEFRKANPNITWEKDLKINVGIEMTLLKNMNLSLDVFKNNRHDILTTPNIYPDFSGMILPYVNNGKVENKGFEVEAGYKNNSGEFKYYVNAGVWYAKNKIIEMSEEVRRFDYLYRTGNPINQPFGLEAIGFFLDQADIDASPKQTFETNVPGDIKYKNQNGDNIIDLEDVVPIGKNTVPELTASLNLGAEFKGFDFDILLHGVEGRSISLSGTKYHALQDNRNIPEIALKRWTPQTASTAAYPRLSSISNSNNYRFSSFWLKDGSFIKVRNIELGYNFPKTVVSAIGVNNLRLFVNGTNLLSFDHIKHSDPEVLSGYPVTRTISAGLSAKF